MIKKIHFIGIGGIGMSAIAIVLQKMDYHITGSDVNSTCLQNLIDLGITVYHGHSPNNILDAQLVVKSTAIKENNSELLAARARNIPVISRGQMLAELMHLYYAIAVTGTHGKTTTTSLLFEIFNYANLQPSCIVGGKLLSTNTNAVLSDGKHFIIEADESDASFLYLFPIMAIVTNIDHDHMETYNHQSSKLNESFLQFLLHIPFYGCAVLWYEDPILRNMITDLKCQVITYGLNESADIYANNIQTNQHGMSFVVNYSKYNLQFVINTHMLGMHNVLNCLSAIAIALEHKIDVITIINAILEFKGVARRTQYYAVNSIKGNLLIDDYGHHPVEIKTTIDGIKKAHQEKKLLLIFQPHRYTRTRDLFNDFIDSIMLADQVILCRTYEANEELIIGYDSLSLMAAIKQSEFNNIVYADSFTQIPNMLKEMNLHNTVVVTMGAGDVTKLAQTIADANIL
jgi:UDP-N-acetylmuramate--alanine ligase